MSTSSTALLEFIRRDDVSFLVTFTDENEDPIDLTGSTVFFTVKRKLTDPDDEALIEKDITVHTDPTQGETTITLTNDDTDFSAGDYVWDLQIKDASNLIASTIWGRIRVIQDVTIRTS